jgi:Na+-driven multidrug efflux pump
MENQTLSVSSDQPTKKAAKIILTILTFYPLFWTVGILLGGLLQSDGLVMFIMLTWVLAFFGGVPTWLTLVIYLAVEKQISIKEVFLHLITATMGIITAYLVYEFDVFSSGVKFID